MYYRPLDVDKMALWLARAWRGERGWLRWCGVGDCVLSGEWTLREALAR